MIPVETPTTIHALLEFQNGTQITYCASWDVWQHGHSNMELYGREGTLHVPDPNFFGGEIRMTKRDAFVNGLPEWAHPFSVANDRGRANYRASGLADMAIAIAEGRQHRCSLEFSLHVVDVMTSILRSGETGTFIDMTTTCDRPDALGPDAAQALLA